MAAIVTGTVRFHRILGRDEDGVNRAPSCLDQERAGGLPFIQSSSEPNPSLGQRGIRFLQQYPQLLQTQLDAMLQLSREFDLHLLVCGELAGRSSHTARLLQCGITTLSAAPPLIPAVKEAVRESCIRDKPGGS